MSCDDIPSLHERLSARAVTTPVTNARGGYGVKGRLIVVHGVGELIRAKSGSDSTIFDVANETRYIVDSLDILTYRILARRRLGESWGSCCNVCS